MLNRRTIAAALLALASLAAAPAAPAIAAALDDIAARKTLRVAVPQDFPPFGSVGADMAPQGYDIDMARLIAEKMGVEAELVPVTSANRIPYLQTGKVDLVISSLGKNPEREAVIDFSAAYAPFYNGVFGPADSGVAAVGDLAGKTVGVTRGSVEDLELSKIAPADATIKRYEDNNGTIAAFLSDQVDVVATGNVVAATILSRKPRRAPSPLFLIKNSPCFIGMPKGDAALKARVDGIIAEAKSSGELTAISEKWLGMALPADI